MGAGFELSNITRPLDGKRFSAIILDPGANIVFPIFRLGAIDHKESWLARLVLRIVMRLGWVKELAISARSDNFASGAAEELTGT